MSIRTRNKVSVNFSMASMTDIVFLLLIFFVIISTMVSPNALNVLLPKSEAKTTKKQQVSVSITPEIRFYINGEETHAAALEGVLAQRLSGQEKPGIVLHTDKRVPVEHVVTVMDIAYRNKYDLVLATTPK